MKGPLAVGGGQPVRLPAPPAAIVQPNAVTGLLAWYKADSLGLSDGAAVATWVDSSGNGHDLSQATGAKQPIYNTGQVNSLPAVTFDGVDDYLATAAFASPTTGVTVMGLCKPTLIDATTRTLVSHAAAATWVSPFARYLVRLDGILRSWTAAVDDAGVVGNFNKPTALAVVNAWQLVEMTYDLSSIFMYSNGEVTGLTARAGSLTSSTQPLFIGADTSLGDCFKGQIVELLVFSGALSAADRKAMERYLMSRAGITVVTGSQAKRLMPAGFARSKGANINMRHGPATGVNFDPQCWSDMWTQWEWSASGAVGAAGNWIKPQIDSAKALGCNTVHLLGSQYCRIGSGSGLVSPAPIDLATYLSRWRQALNYVRSIGMFAYVGFGGDSQICDFGSQYGFTPGAAWLLQEYKDVATMWAEYRDIIIGVDLSTEAAIWASNTANSQPIYNAVKAILPSVSLSWSQVVTSGAHGVGNMVPASVLDHYDVHVYYDMQVNDLDAILALGKPVLLGEYGIDSASSTGARQTRYASVRNAVDRTLVGSWLAGSHVWSMYDQAVLAADNYGLCTAAGVPRADVLSIFQSIPS